MTDPARILVAGAGPAGLALALQARDHGADVRVIDRRPALAKTRLGIASRAASLSSASTARHLW